jgi:predicted enzyme related to lactoylglutathione lyase
MQTTTTSTSTTTLGALLLSSTRPDRLRDWYTAALEPDRKTSVQQYEVLAFGGVHLLIDTRDDIGDTNPEPGRVIVTFEVPDAAAAAARIDGLGAEWLAPLEDRDGSLFATAIDPDGNYVQIVQFSEAARQARSEM